MFVVCYHFTQCYERFDQRASVLLLYLSIIYMLRAEILSEQYVASNPPVNFIQITIF